jgi:hypothetical protein
MFPANLEFQFGFQRCALLVRVKAFKLLALLIGNFQHFVSLRLSNVRYRMAHVNWRKNPMKKFLISGAVVAFAATSAFAQTTVASEFYVVRDETTKKCTIVDKKPTTTTTTIVDNGIFKTRTEAETGMKTMKVCTSN